MRLIRAATCGTCEDELEYCSNGQHFLLSRADPACSFNSNLLCRRWSGRVEAFVPSGIGTSVDTGTFCTSLVDHVLVRVLHIFR